MVYLCLLFLLLSQVTPFQINRISNPCARHTDRGRRTAALDLSAPLSELSDRFDRWKFLQDLLDGDADNDLANEALYLVLDAALKNSPDSKSDAAPELTPEKRSKIETVLATAEDGMIPALGTSEDDALLEAIQSILPDPVEDEDANKSTWDIVMQLYGREMTKVSERDATYEWTISCSVTRALLHFDFLESGIQS